MAKGILTRQLATSWYASNLTNMPRHVPVQSKTQTTTAVYVIC